MPLVLAHLRQWWYLRPSPNPVGFPAGKVRSDREKSFPLEARWLVPISWSDATQHSRFLVAGCLGGKKNDCQLWGVLLYMCPCLCIAGVKLTSTHDKNKSDHWFCKVNSDLLLDWSNMLQAAQVLPLLVEYCRCLCYLPDKIEDKHMTTVWDSKPTFCITDIVDTYQINEHVWIQHVLQIDLKNRSCKLGLPWNWKKPRCQAFLSHGMGWFETFRETHKLQKIGTFFEKTYRNSTTSIGFFHPNLKFIAQFTCTTMINILHYWSLQIRRILPFGKQVMK